MWIMSVTKGQVIELLKSYGVSDLSVLENPEVNMQNLVFALQRSRIKVAEGFFVELANRLGLVYVTGDQLKGKSELAIALPYRILEENLSVPLEVSAEKVKIATANPLNTEFFALLEDTLRAKVEVLVASIESIDGAIGKGYEDIHKYRALRDLRYRDPDESAYRVLYAWQREFLIGTLILIIIIFVFNYPLSFIVVIAAINILYFCVNPVKFYIAFRGFKRSSRSVYVSNDDLLKLDESTLPEYTILIPIYHEAQVLPHIIENIYRIDYPRDKLDVKILMEEKDQETIAEARRLGLFGKPQTVVAPIISLGQSSEHVKILELGPSIKVIDSEATTVGTLDSVVTQADGGAILNVKRPNGEIMQIPEGFVRSVGDVVRLEDTLDVLLARYMDALGVFDAVVVPDAEIRTKPRACNYGLLRARGEYCVIYDAEDDPEPDQLKKAAVAFSRLPEQCVCLQSRLNFYNPKENILTRWFSLEYGYWFDFYLEGLDQVGAPLPLGGTSNHFRTRKLRELGGWDPYNVTEDADLGVRISRKRLKTAMLNSYTFEEATKEILSWIRQRSRWNKGYVQTYLVHMRHPRRLVREMGWKQFFYFQLTFGGNILLPLLNPLLWAITVLTLIVPGVFNFLFFYPIVYVCIFNLVVGNLVYITIHAVSCVIRKDYSSMPFALIIPLYWVLISIGCWRGTLQLITKPFYWEKTQHGLTHVYGKVQV
jgi:cellulose synthase/poly-beta-1,6-N-acetylglucosamine synthase-like glycosyltransferase